MAERGSEKEERGQGEIMDVKSQCKWTGTIMQTKTERRK